MNLRTSFKSFIVHLQQTQQLQSPGGGFDTVPEEGAVHSRQECDGLHANTPGHHGPVRRADTSGRTAVKATEGCSG